MVNLKHLTWLHKLWDLKIKSVVFHFSIENFALEHEIRHTNLDSLKIKVKFTVVEEALMTHCMFWIESLNKINIKIITYTSFLFLCQIKSFSLKVICVGGNFTVFEEVLMTHCMFWTEYFNIINTTFSCDWQYNAF